MRLPRHFFRWFFAILVGLPLAVYLALVIVTRPRTDRVWANEQSRTAIATLTESTLALKDVRDFLYTGNGSIKQYYRSGSYDLSTLRDVWFVTSPFKTMPKSAHTFLSFRFQDGRTLGVSIEARRERTEEYSTWKGMLRQYELLYVWATERDLLRLRAVERQDRVELYKLALTPEQGAAVLTALASESEAARTSPVFYNTLTNNCTTATFDALRTGLGSAPSTMDMRMIFSAQTPEMLREGGLIAEDISHEKADVTERIRSTPNDARFSDRLRETL